MAANPQDAVILAERLEAIINSPGAIHGLKDDAVRRRLREAGRKLSLAMEDAGDTTHRIANTVRDPKPSRYIHIQYVNH